MTRSEMLTALLSEDDDKRASASVGLLAEAFVFLAGSFVKLGDIAENTKRMAGAVERQTASLKRIKDALDRHRL